MINKKESDTYPYLKTISFYIYVSVLLYIYVLCPAVSSNKILCLNTHSISSESAAAGKIMETESFYHFPIYTRGIHLYPISGSGLRAGKFSFFPDDFYVTVVTNKFSYFSLEHKSDIFMMWSYRGKIMDGFKFWTLLLLLHSCFISENN